MKRIEGSITAPKGFLAAAVFCDIKRLGTGKGSEKGDKLDLGLIVSAVPAAVAGTFTTNQVCAAPVKVSIAHAKRACARAIVVNSGNANACTGRQGLEDARRMARLTAAGLTGLARIQNNPWTAPQRARIVPRDVLVASTGRIGVPLPMANVERGIVSAIQQLGSTRGHATRVADAILTSDTRRKEIAVAIKLGGAQVRIGGVCKGAGMIQPGMSPNGTRPASAPRHATMLCFLTSDVAIEPGLLKIALREAVARSFNRITVDGDMSTNDTVVMLANGLAGNRPIAAPPGGVPAGRGEYYRRLPVEIHRFQEALNHVTLELAKMIVQDGEGASRFVTIHVRGARSPADADLAARAVANSLLVKTSWCGGDPNWGRILAALGYSAAAVAEDRIDLAYRIPGRNKPIVSVRRGKPTAVAFPRLCGAVARREFELHVDLHLGGGCAVVYTADLTEAYVDFNKGDLSNPAALGG